MVNGPNSLFIHHPAIGARIRAGAYADHATSTYALAEEAARAGRGADAAELARYTVQEALEAYELFTVWCVKIPEFIAGHGIAPEIIAAQSARLASLWVEPDGTAFDGGNGQSAASGSGTGSLAQYARPTLRRGLFLGRRSRTPPGRGDDRRIVGRIDAADI